jgi:hypothetical protein
MDITKLMAPKPLSPSYNIIATISMCINWTKGLHHQVQGLHLYHHHRPSLSKHHGSKAMIKQSSCASTGPITNRGSTISSNTSSRSSKDHHHPCKGSSSMWAISICNLHQRTTSSISKVRSKSFIIRGSSKVISMTIMTMIIIMYTSSRDNIIIKVASYRDHCKGHTSSSPLDIRLPTFVVGIKDNPQSGVGINDNL